MRRSKLMDLRVRDVMSRNPVTASPDDALGDVLGKMKQYDIHEVPVVRGKEVVGIVTMAGVMRRKAIPPSTNAITIAQSCPQVSPEEDLPTVAERLLTGGFRGLPVMEKRRLVGIVSQTDLVRAIADLDEFSDVVVSTVSTPHPQTVRENDSVEVAIRLMQSLGERTVPVTDANGRLVGVVGHKDVAALFARPKTKARSGEAAGERERLALEVKGLMRYPVVTVGPGATVDHVADLMLKHDISSLVVAEKDQPAGIVTKLDLVELVAGLKEREELLVQISGLEERPEVYDSLYGVIRKAMMKIAHIVTPRTLTIHVQTYKAEGDRFKSSLRARFATSHKMYYLTHFDWDLHKAMQGLMDILEKQILKEKERRVTERKRHHGA